MHSVPDRNVSISQLYIRPIVWEKAAAPVAFGANMDFILATHGLGWSVFWQINFTGTDSTLVTAKSMKSVYQDRLLDGHRTMLKLTKRRNKKMTLTKLQWKEPSLLQSKNKGLHFAISFFQGTNGRNSY